jgi:tRNA A-37 threonylcarbamoyl transferase component Bud32
VEYPRLAHQWRTHSVEPAESSNLSAGGLSRHPAFFPQLTEQTESREDLAKPRGADPESTEEIMAANRATRSLKPPKPFASTGATTVAARLTGLAASARARLEITHPIELPGPSREGKAAPVTHAPPRVHLARDDDNSAELVELVVEQDEPRTCVRAGDTLAGRYTVCEQVDHRGMGIVFKALDRKREKAGMRMPWVALKFARAAAENNAATATYLRQEFLNLSQLNHPNIVSVFDFDSDGGLEFIVMEWLEGQTLADMLSQITSKRIALYKADEIVHAVAGALAHAHERGVVHGDVKPSNIFLTGNRAVKLLDFGSSMQASADADTEGNWATRAYASCEVLRGALPQPHDDVYALGVTAYRLMSGEWPFGDLDASEAQTTDSVVSPLPPDAERSWHAIEHALRFDARDRPAHAGEFLMELRDPPLETAEPRERSQLEHIAYGAVAAALLIALVVLTVGSIGGLPAQQQDVLARAEAAFADGRLVGDDSALELYSSVLQLSPDHPVAVAGLQSIAERYLANARQALAEDDPGTARELLATARQVMPGHYGIPITEDLIARFGKDLLFRATGAAATDLEEAERLLADASAFLPADDAGVVAVAAQLEQMRKEATLQELLQEIDQRILAERLSLPSGDSAMDLLHRARELAPGDRQVMLAADRIATALLFQSMFAISSGKLDDAERFIDGAKSLNVEHLALSRAEYELAKARHDDVRTRRSR